MITDASQSVDTARGVAAATANADRTADVAHPPSFGVELAGVEARVFGWSAEQEQAVPAGALGASGSSPVAGASTGPALPPAVLVPRFAGEPVRVDLSWPPMPRGTGEPWPPDARIEPGQMTGRFPIAYAWPMLDAGEDWAWRYDGRTVCIHPADAITDVLHAAIGQRDRLSVDTRICMVVPDHLPVRCQQQLINAARSRQIDLHLMWRPVAAAQAWCGRFGDQLDNERPDAGGRVGSLLALHLGLDRWEAAVVDLVARRYDGDVQYVPVRRRQFVQPLVSYGLELMHRLAVRSLEMSYQQMTPARVWELLWCTPWMHTALALLSGRTDERFPKVIQLAKHARRTEFLVQQCRQATQRIFRHGEHVPALLRQCLGLTPQFTEIRDWLAACKRRFADQPLLGAVVTGPMALAPHEGDRAGVYYLQKIWPEPTRVLVEGQTLPRGCLAQAAAEHVDRQKQAGGLTGSTAPTWLEQLPRIRIAAHADGTPAWVDLLEHHGDPAIGDAPHRRPKPLSGLPIKAGTRQFKIAVWHEDLPTVHIAAARLPQALLAPEPVTLHASVRPGNGHPLVELVPQRQALFGRHRVAVDFLSMKDTGKTPKQFLQSMRA